MKDISPQDAWHLLELLPQPVLLLENTGSIRGFNRAFRSLIGEESGSAADLTLEPGLLQPLLGTSSVVNWITPNGDERWLAVEIIELPNMPDTQARCYIDITEKLRLKHERDALQKELDDQALYDPRHGSLLSRRGILVSLAPLVARSRRYNSPLSIVTLSISTAEEHRSAARSGMTSLLRDQTRWADLVGCNSDGAFILVLQESTRDAAMLLVEKLAVHIDRMSAYETPLTASYGVTEYQKNDNAESLLERGEQALAEAVTNATGRAIAL